MGWIVAGVLVGLLLIDLALHAVYGAIMLRSFERKLPFVAERFGPDPDAETVAFSTSGGLTLRGSLSRHQQQPSRGLIVFCPEHGGSHWSVGWYARGLWEAGFDLLAFDFRNQGESDADDRYDPLHWVTEYEVADVLAAVHYVRRREELKDLPIGLFGVSRGGGAALAAAARSPEVKCVAAEGAFSTGGLFMHFTLRWAVLYVPKWLLKLLPVWHIRWTIAMVRRVVEFRRGCRYFRLERHLPALRNTPTLLIGGAKDTYVHPDLTWQLSRQMGEGPHAVWIAPGAKHNMARRADPDAYDAKLVDLFSTMAPDPCRKEVLGQT